MVICKCCGNWIDKSFPEVSLFIPVCPSCSSKPDNKDFMERLEILANSVNNIWADTGDTTLSYITIG